MNISVQKTEKKTVSKQWHWKDYNTHALHGEITVKLKWLITIISIWEMKYFWHAKKFRLVEELSNLNVNTQMDFFKELLLINSFENQLQSFPSRATL